MKAINWNKIIRRISTLLLLLTVIIQAITIVLLETASKESEIEELHELCGFAFFGLIIIHIILFRKSIKNMISSKNS